MTFIGSDMYCVQWYLPSITETCFVSIACLLVRGKSINMDCVVFFIENGIGHDSN